MSKKLTMLESTFWFALITHGIGLITMALFLLPGIPGGTIPDYIRVKYIAEHQTLWQIGWLPWHLSALSDLMIAIAMMQLPQIPMRMRILILAATVIAIIPDQLGQILWVRDGSTIAQIAIARTNLPIYLKFEQPIYMMVCGWAALFYSVLAVGWTIALKPVINASPTFYKFSWSIWALSGACSLLFLASSILPIPFVVLAVANAIFFPLLLLWFAWVIEYLIRGQRQAKPWGRQAVWTLPETVPFRPVFQLLGDCHCLKRIFEYLRPVALTSEIEGVVYVNYLVEAKKLEALVPEHLELQRIGPEGKYALFTLLTFRHKFFGPQFSTMLRKTLNVTGIVSNWRIHVSDPQTKLDGIYFVTNVTDNVLIALGARILSEGMAMQVAHSAEFKISEAKYFIQLDPGKGSAADLKAQLEIDDSLPALYPPWSECFTNYNDFLAYCVPQDRAISSQAYLERVSFQEIRLGIPLDQCRLLKGQVESKAAASIAGNEQPLCFAAPTLHFRFDREHCRPVKND